jgi:hypothetical protein
MTKSNKGAVQPNKCTVCGRVLKTGTTCGATCQANAKIMATGILRRSYYKVVAMQPVGTISMPALHNLCKAAGISTAPSGPMVQCTGGDSGLRPPAAPVCQVYLVGRTRYMAAWLGTKQGLAAIMAYSPKVQGSNAKLLAAPTSALVQA